MRPDPPSNEPGFPAWRTDPHSAARPSRFEGGVPHTVGGHRLLGHLGRGGFGDVYRALSPEMNVERALKLLREPWDRSRLARFEREAAALGQVRHPGVVGVHEFGVEGDLTYLVMELIEGPSLAEVAGAGPLPLERALELLEKLGRGIGALHRAGIIHRDLKPENVVLRGGNEPVVIDLGLALAPERDQRLTRTGASAGTPAYMAPEQVEGREVGPTVDVFALGVVLGEVITGRSRFPEGLSQQELLVRILSGATPLPSAANPDLPARLDVLVARATALDPAARYPDGDAFAEAVAAVRLAPGPSRRRRRLALGAGALGLVGALGSVAASLGALRVEPQLAKEAGKPGPEAPPRAEGRAPSAVATVERTGGEGGRVPGPSPLVIAHPGGWPPRQDDEWFLQHCHLAWVAANQLLVGMRTRSAQVVVFGLPDGRELRRFEVPGLRGLALAPDGRAFAAVGDGILTVLPLDGGPARLRLQASHGAYSVCWVAPERLAVGHDDGAVEVRSLPDGRLLARFPGQGARAVALAASADGRILAVGHETLASTESPLRMGQLRVLDLPEEAERSSTSLLGSAGALALSPDGSALVVGGSGDRVFQFVFAEGGLEQRRSLVAPEDRVVEDPYTRFAAANPSHWGGVERLAYWGRWIVSTGGDAQTSREIRVWDAATGEQVRRVELPAAFPAGAGLAVGPGGVAVRTGRDEVTVYPLDAVFPPGE